MIAKLSDVKLTMLAWLPMPPDGPHPPEATPCLFSNGAIHMLATADQLRAFDVTRRFYFKPTHWAKMNDLTPIFERKA